MKIVLSCYIILFIGLFKVQSANTAPQNQVIDYNKPPQLINHLEEKQPEQPKKLKTEKKPGSVSTFSLFKFVNFLYTKDSLNNDIIIM
ncbi:MAG: hypothetical protein ACK504_00660 [Bacteroidota bacterium]